MEHGPGYLLAAPQLLSRLHLLIAVLAMAPLGGCGLGSEVRVKTPADVCVETMRRALPEAQFDITKQTSEADTLTRTRVDIEATRTDAPPSALIMSDVAAECMFDRDTLVDFHWTKGPFK